MYQLIKPDKSRVSVFVVDQDEKSIKIMNIDGYTRWIQKTDFILKNKLIILKSTNNGCYYQTTTSDHNLLRRTKSVSSLQ